MNRYIPDEIVDEIRNRCDIVELINSYLPLKRAGNNYKACCPFHQEKTPSFTVNPQRNTFHCFGCGKGGDIFRFIMEREGIDFPNAVHLLAQRYNVIIPENNYPGSSPEKSKQRLNERERLYALHEKICAWFQQNLRQNPDSPVSVYLRTRNLPDEAVKKFCLGASPDSWDAALNWGKQNGFTEEELLLSGIITQKEDSGKVYDRFRNRLMFPIWNEQGKVVAFSARTVDPNPQGGKYVNSPETPIFKKSNVLYGLSLARQAIRDSNFLILCEGQLDVIAMHRAGFENSAAPQGTAFTEEQARMIKRYTDRLYLAFDSDGAGIKAAVRAVEIALPEGFEIKVICYPEGQDPDDIIRNQGIEAIKPLVEGAIDFFDFLFRRQCLEFDATSPVGKGRIVGEMIKYLAKVESQVTRTAYASELAIRLKLPQESVFNELNREKRQRNFKNDAYVPVREQDSGSETSAEQGGSAMEELPGKIRKAEETLLELSLTHGTIAKQLESELPARMISNTPVGKALEQVILFTVNGEWEFAEKHLRTEQMNLESPDTTLSKILNAPHEHTHAFQEKAASDCIKLIKSYQIQLEIDHLLQKIKNTDSADDKKTMLKQFNLLSKSLAELNRPEKKK